MKLFRFYGFTMHRSVEYFVKDIMSNRLPCNNPINFNDPFEGLYFFNGLTDDEEKRLKVYKQNIRKQIPEKKKMLFDIPNATLTNRVVVACLCSESIFEQSICDLMWAHYANNHNGVCVEYEFDDDWMKNFEKDDEGYRIYDCSKERYHFSAKNLIVRSVNYDDVPPRPIEFERGIAKTDNLEYLYTKPKVWSYENEIRIIVSLMSCNDEHAFNLNNHYAVEYKGECLKSIRLGVSVEEVSRNSIIDTIKKERPTCLLYQSYLSEDSFHIQYERIDKN